MHRIGKDRDHSRFKCVRALFATIRAQNDPEARGRRLLREWLSSRQREQFDADRCFDVIGGDTGARYRIHYGTSANIRNGP
ncbi:hypothetical protein [Bradyrhizobium sp. th.b2]|uniref:hypothetical protein n=1 Tax=Bradyrhizobium sp. th-b2 TaxID=172088 RepID=UPI001FD9FC59|nr:hypothetical protein [Bradyrhizobium sp. th.b2]